MTLSKAQLLGPIMLLTLKSNTDTSLIFQRALSDGGLPIGMLES